MCFKNIYPATNSTQPKTMCLLHDKTVCNQFRKKKCFKLKEYSSFHFAWQQLNMKWNKLYRVRICEISGVSQPAAQMVICASSAINRTLITFYKHSISIAAADAFLLITWILSCWSTVAIATTSLTNTSNYFCATNVLPLTCHQQWPAVADKFM